MFFKRTAVVAAAAAAMTGHSIRMMATATAQSTTTAAAAAAAGSSSLRSTITRSTLGASSRVSSVSASGGKGTDEETAAAATTAQQVEIATAATQQSLRDAMNEVVASSRIITGAFSGRTPPPQSVFSFPKQLLSEPQNDNVQLLSTQKRFDNERQTPDGGGDVAYDTVGNLINLLGVLSSPSLGFVGVTAYAQVMISVNDDDDGRSAMHASSKRLLKGRSAMKVIDACSNDAKDSDGGVGDGGSNSGSDSVHRIAVRSAMSSVGAAEAAVKSMSDLCGEVVVVTGRLRIHQNHFSSVASTEDDTTTTSSESSNSAATQEGKQGAGFVHSVAVVVLPAESLHTGMVRRLRVPRLED